MFVGTPNTESCLFGRSSDKNRSSQDVSKRLRPPLNKFVGASIFWSFLLWAAFSPQKFKASESLCEGLAFTQVASPERGDFQGGLNHGWSWYLPHARQSSPQPQRRQSFFHQDYDECNLSLPDNSSFKHGKRSSTIFWCSQQTSWWCLYWPR